jgi:hypothetical protein
MQAGLQVPILLSTTSNISKHMRAGTCTDVGIQQQISSKRSTVSHIRCVFILFLSEQPLLIAQQDSPHKHQGIGKCTAVQAAIA